MGHHPRGVVVSVGLACLAMVVVGCSGSGSVPSVPSRSSTQSPSVPQTEAPTLTSSTSPAPTMPAAVDSAQSGVRQLAFASANANNATAGIINQVQARLDGFAIDADMIDATVYPTLAALTAAVPLPPLAGGMPRVDGKVDVRVADWQALSAAEREKLRAQATLELYRLGAHSVIDHPGELPACLDDLAIRRSKGEKP